MTGTMRALRAHSRDDAASLAVEDVPVPEPGIGDALVRVHAASFTPTELDWPSTWVDRNGHPRGPATPGHELSGMVTGLGYGTTGLAIGDEVYGLCDWYRDGSVAEYVAVEARNLAPKPPSLDHATAGSVPLAALTAWQALFVHGELSEGQSVLVHGAAGGVGTFAVQLAHDAGARVVATGRGWARDLVMQLGADRFVDLERERFEEVAGGMDLVLDLIGGAVLQRSPAALRPGGALVSAVEALAPADGIRTVFFVVEADTGQLREVGRLVDAGRLRPVVGRVSPLAEAPAAFAAKRARGIAGKVVISPV